jgi:hypothetical protein
MQLWAVIQKYLKCTSFSNVDVLNNFSNVVIFTYVIADILLYPKSLGSTQTVKFSRRKSSQSATHHKIMFSAYRNMISVLCEIGPRLTPINPLTGGRLVVLSVRKKASPNSHSFFLTLAINKINNFQVWTKDYDLFKNPGPGLFDFGFDEESKEKVDPENEVIDLEEFRSFINTDPYTAWKNGVHFTVTK